MVVDPVTAAGTISSVFDLAKVAWKLGSSLVKLYQGTKCVDDTVEKLAGEVKSLGNECDLVHAELEEVVKGSKNGEPSPYDLEDRLWKCLDTKVQECSQTIQALSVLVRDIAEKASGFIGQAQRQMRLNKNRDNLEKIRGRVRTHTDGLRTTLLVINIKVAHLAPGNANRELSQKLDNLQNMVDTLQRSLDGTSDTDTTLVDCARDVIKQGSTMHEGSLVMPSIVEDGRGAASSNIRVAQWVSAIDALRREEPPSEHSDTGSRLPSVFSGDEEGRSMNDVTSVQHEIAESDGRDDLVDQDSDDELAIDLAKAAWESGSQAFGTLQWQEADMLLQETLHVLQQLPKGQRAFCDTFDLQYKLAVCAYHTQNTTDAEAALASLLDQVPNTDEQRRYVCEVAHLLSVLYIRMDQLERARSSCEKALKARRRLLGKDADATLASTALLVRIYQMLQSHTRAKVYLTMIPEARRPDMLRCVDESLGADQKLLDVPSLLARSQSESSDLEQSMDRLNLTPSNSEATSSAWSGETFPSTIATSLSTRGALDSSNMHGATVAQSDLPVGVEPLDVLARMRPSKSNTMGPDGLTKVPSVCNLDTVVTETDTGPNLAIERPILNRTRNQILENLALKPKTALDKAICFGSREEDLYMLIEGQHFEPTSHPIGLYELDTIPLHYAALFGEVDIARRILSTWAQLTNVTTGAVSITMASAFHWAFLARQADVLNLFLTTRPEVLRTLAKAPDMSSKTYKCWIGNTVYETERFRGSHVPSQFIAMAKVLLKHGWPVNRGIGVSDWTLLHYAAHLGHEYDPHGTIASFLCEKGAFPMQRDRSRETPYSIASRSSNRSLVLIFDQYFEEYRMNQHRSSFPRSRTSST